LPRRVLCTWWNGRVTVGSPAKPELVFEERFQDPAVLEERWIPHYLPQWSSRERSRARYALGPEGIALRIDQDQAPWAPEWDGDLRVSNLQTGVRSGPVGSASGQHRFRPDLVVREQQDERWTYTPHYGAVEVRARANPDPQVMVALWLIGVERVPEECAELCVVEIFGSEVGEDRGLVGMGVHAFGDPRVSEDFEKIEVLSDLTLPHDYRVDWTPSGTAFAVDGIVVKRSAQSPDYPMQLMLDIFEFGREPGGHYPKEFAVEHVLGWDVSTR
jgi:hypothetical protein